MLLNNNKLTWLLGCFLVVASMVLFVASIQIGAIHINLIDLMHHSQLMQTVLPLHLNRAVIAFCCGGLLALASFITQSTLRNPLIAPDTIGMTSIACLLILLKELYFPAVHVSPMIIGIVGAFFGVLLALFLSGSFKKNTGFTLLLVGIGLSFFTIALTRIILTFGQQNVTPLIGFLAGSLYGVSTNQALAIAILTVILLPICLICSGYLKFFILDDMSLASIGFSVTKMRCLYLLLSAILIGVSVIGLGNMGFLGVVVPNIVRLCLGHKIKSCLINSFLLGGMLYLLADLIGRNIILPNEIPAGIIIDIICVPLFFIVLINIMRGRNARN